MECAHQYSTERLPILCLPCCFRLVQESLLRCASDVVGSRAGRGLLGAEAWAGPASPLRKLTLRGRVSLSPTPRLSQRGGPNTYLPVSQDPVYPGCRLHSLRAFLRCEGRQPHLHPMPIGPAPSSRGPGVWLTGSGEEAGRRRWPPSAWCSADRVVGGWPLSPSPATGAGHTQARAPAVLPSCPGPGLLR